MNAVQNTIVMTCCFKYFYLTNNGKYIIENERTCYSTDINWIEIIQMIFIFKMNY